MTRDKQTVIENGKRLRQLRGIRTRTGVAREVGISYAALAFYESGERNPSGHVKKKLADYYGVPVELIFQ
jgi:transcriptional regulator with XRE-family HTH domain